MKKHLAIILAAAMAISAVPAASVSAAENDQKKDFVLFGDSIAAGVTRANNLKYNYGEILADYYSGTVSNYAVSGDTSDQMLEKIKSLTADQKNAVKEAECVVISVGGNDIIYYACHEFLTFFAENNLLSNGYTADNIPEKPSLTELTSMMNKDDLKAYASNFGNLMLLIDKITRVSASLTNDQPEKGYEGYIKNHIIKNISDSVAEIKSINPDTKIVVQNIYQPLQIDENYLNSTLGSSYSTLFSTIRALLEEIMGSFDEELDTLAASDNFLVADVYTDFTSKEEGTMLTKKSPGNASYFVDVKTKSIMDDSDIHPNQKGHLAIASTIINTLGDKHNDLGLLSDIYENLSDKNSYPAVAKAAYESAAGPLVLGDVTFDGVIDARDATTALTGYALTSAGKTGLKARQNLAADATQDGTLDARDATFILTYYAKASAGKAGSFDDYVKEQTK